MAPNEIIRNIVNFRTKETVACQLFYLDQSPIPQTLQMCDTCRHMQCYQKLMCTHI